MTTEKVYTLGLKYKAHSPFLQYIAVKTHDAGGTALFVSGLPYGLNEVTLKELFEAFGSVIQAVLHPLKVSVSGTV